MRNVVASLVLAGAFAGVWAISQPPPPATTGELQFPKLQTPQTCSAGREGRVYYDMDVDTPYWCDDTNWVSFTGLTIAGTFPFVPRFNSTGLNIEDSVLRATGLPAAGASGDLLDVTKTVAVMDGSDTVRILNLDITNANHTGASNELFGIHISNSARDTEAVERAIVVDSSWDTAFYSTDGMVQIAGDGPAAGASGTNGISFPGTVAAMNGSDSVQILNLALNAGNHTGTGNTLSGIRFDDISGAGANDADAIETALLVGDWDAIFIASAKATAWNAPNEPTSNYVAFYVDESGANCNFTARLADGTEVVVAILVVAGNCP